MASAGPYCARRVSHVFLVDRIEPCLSFWVDLLGFEIRVRVGEADSLEFVTLGRDEVEVMYRTRSSMDEDAPGLAERMHGPSDVLYIEVDQLENLIPKLDHADIVIPLRQTCLGTQEVFVVEPSGRIVAFTTPYADAA